MHLLTKFLFSAGAIGGSAGLSWLTYSQLFSSEEVSSIQFQRIVQNPKNKSKLLKRTGIKGFTDDLDEAEKKVQEWCKEKRKTGLSQFDLYICEGKSITVKEAISNDRSDQFIEKEEEYGYSLFMLKHEFQSNPQGKELLKTITDNKKLKDWREIELAKPFSEEMLDSLWLAEQLCKSSYITTVQDKVKFEHLRREEGEWKKTNDFESNLESWKNESAFTELLKQQNSSISTENLDKEKLEKWCNDSLKIKMTDSITPTFITYVEFVCSGKTPSQMQTAEREKQNELNS